MKAGHKEKRFFLETTAYVCVWRMEGKCEDWVLEEKGGGKNVENVDSLSKIMEGQVWRDKVVAVRNLKRYLLGWYPRDIKCRLFRSVKHKLNLTDLYFSTGKIPLFQ